MDGVLVLVGKSTKKESISIQKSLAIFWDQKSLDAKSLEERKRAEEKRCVSYSADRVGSALLSCRIFGEKHLTKKFAAFKGANEEQWIQLSLCQRPLALCLSF